MAPPLHLKNRIIPGYNLLSQSARDDFEETDEGRRFLNALTPLYKRGWLWNTIATDDSITAAKDTLTANLQSLPNYIDLIQKISRQVLLNYWEPFTLITRDEQTQLLQALCALPSPFDVQELYAQLISNVKEGSVQISSINELMADAVNKLPLNHLEAFLMAIHQTTIRLDNEARDYSQQRLNHATDYEEDDDEHPYLTTAKARWLQTIVFDQLQAVSSNHFPNIELEDFNREQASSLASTMEQSHSTLVVLLDDYTQQLHAHIKSLLSIDKQNHYQVPRHKQMDSLTWFFRNLTEATAPELREAAGRFADAHAFIQGTGFATQNESSYLSFLDLYNYTRWQQQLADLKTTLYGLLAPFQPLVQEYKNIGLYERNPVSKVFRSVMPMLIVAATVVLISFLLSSIAIPDFAFLVILLPTLYIGLALASLYIHVKDSFYRTALNALHGGAYNIPAYQLNDRVLLAFRNDSNLAEKVRMYYVDAIKECDLKEQDYASRHLLLTEAERTDRATNNKRRGELILEWYDIHENSRLGIDSLPDLVQYRLSLDHDKLYMKQQGTTTFGWMPGHYLPIAHTPGYWQDEQRQISEHIDYVTTDLEARLNNQPPLQGHSPRFFSTADKHQAKHIEDIQQRITTMQNR